MLDRSLNPRIPDKNRKAIALCSRGSHGFIEQYTQTKLILDRKMYRRTKSIIFQTRNLEILEALVKHMKSLIGCTALYCEWDRSQN